MSRSSSIARACSLSCLMALLAGPLFCMGKADLQYRPKIYHNSCEFKRGDYSLRFQFDCRISRDSHAAFVELLAPPKVELGRAGAKIDTDALNAALAGIAWVRMNTRTDVFEGKQMRYNDLRDLIASMEEAMKGLALPTFPGGLGVPGLITDFFYSSVEDNILLPDIDDGRIAEGSSDYSIRGAVVHNRQYITKIEGGNSIVSREAASVPLEGQEDTSVRTLLVEADR